MQAWRLATASARVKGVEVDATVDIHRQDLADVPRGSGGHEAAPEVGRAAQRARRGVIHKVDDPRWVDLWDRSLATRLVGQRLGGLVRHGNDDRCERRLRFGISWIVFPTGNGRPVRSARRTPARRARGCALLSAHRDSPCQIRVPQFSSTFDTGRRELYSEARTACLDTPLRA